MQKMKTKIDEIMAAARSEAAQATNWADFSNYLFDPEEGIVSRLFAKRSDRERFAKTPEYQELQRLMEEVQDRTGLEEGATPRKSGKFVVRLPRSLHAALENEAQREGVSLNQLVVAKLAVPMSDIFAGGAGSPHAPPPAT
jgi:predicted HicB family RNase H-like nuclease